MKKAKEKNKKKNKKKIKKSWDCYCKISVTLESVKAGVYFSNFASMAHLRGKPKCKSKMSFCFRQE